MAWFDQIASRISTSPFLWGGGTSIAFHMVLAKAHDWVDPMVLRYSTGRWENYLSTTLFFVGVSYLVKRGAAIGIQTWMLGRLPAANSTDAAARDKSLEAWRLAVSKTPGLSSMTLGRRIQELSGYRKQQPAAPLHAYAKELSEADYDRLYYSYGFIRLLTWAIPSCGSLATILAVARTVERLTSGANGDALSGATAGLAEAFNLFAFSLGLSMALVVLKFVVEQADQRLLNRIDHRLSPITAAEPEGRPATADNLVDQVRELTQSVGEMARSLSLQASAGPAVAGASGRSTAPATPWGSPQEFGAAIERAMSAAMERQTQTGLGGASAVGGVDAAGWRSLQQVLQKLAVVLEQQHAKLESEGRVSKQLTAIIDAELNQEKSPMRLRVPARTGDELAGVLGR
ncbi:MAG: hypothetical protein U0795_26230 [Pirellulales bacterium]